MFSLKADFIRLLVGVIMFMATNFWLFEFVGAVIILCALLNFVLRAAAPQVISQAKANFERAYPTPTPPATDDSVNLPTRVH